MNKGIFDFPPTLPSLQRAYKIGTKAQKRKFDWHHLKDVQAKLTEELTEFQEAIESKNKTAMQDELGDVLFTIAQIARHLEIEPEQALRKSNYKFETRFESMLKLAREKNLAWESLSDPEKEGLWNDIKTSHQNWARQRAGDAQVRAQAEPFRSSQKPQTDLNYAGSF